MDQKLYFLVDCYEWLKDFVYLFIISVSMKINNFLSVNEIGKLLLKSLIRYK